MRKQNHLASFIVFCIMLGACSPFLDASTEVCEPDDFKCEYGFPPNKYWAPYHRFHYHPLVSTQHITILADDMGNPWTPEGKRIVIVGEGDEIVKAYRKWGKVYLVME